MLFLLSNNFCQKFADAHILSDTYSEIKIVLTSKEGKCPFGRWECPRQFKGKFYVAKMMGGAGVWLDSWEEIDSSI